MASKEIPLNWDVFVAKRRGLTRDLPPGKEQLNWVGGSATLIYGGSDAVLVDTLLTRFKSEKLLKTRKGRSVIGTNGSNTRRNYSYATSSSRCIFGWER